MNLKNVFNKIDGPQCAPYLTLSIIIIFFTWFYFQTNFIKSTIVHADKQESLYLDSISEAVLVNKEILHNLNNNISALKEELRCLELIKNKY